MNWQGKKFLWAGHSNNLCWNPSSEQQRPETCPNSWEEPPQRPKDNAKFLIAEHSMEHIKECTQRGRDPSAVNGAWRYFWCSLERTVNRFWTFLRWILLLCKECLQTWSCTILTLWLPQSGHCHTVPWCHRLLSFTSDQCSWSFWTPALWSPVLFWHELVSPMERGSWTVQIPASCKEFFKNRAILAHTVFYKK